LIQQGLMSFFKMNIFSPVKMIFTITIFSVLDVMITLFTQ